MESTDDNTLNDLMLDVSLAANLPLNLAGRDRIRTIAAVNALGCITEVLGTRELKKLEYAVAPLLSLLEGSDVDDPVVIKASYALLTLMQSRICMREFLAKGGIVIASKILDYLLGVDLSLDLKVPSHYTKVLENLSCIYKEISVHHPWDVIKVGGIRHCVTMLRRGEANMCATAVGALASMCVDETVCKLMFSNGATKPIIAVSDADVTNEVCMLAGLGCITQLSRIPDVAIKIARQGVVKVLEKALVRTAGVVPHQIREKAVFALEWLARVSQIRPILATPAMLRGLTAQMSTGTILAKAAVCRILLFLHGKYPKGEEALLMREVRDHMIAMLTQGDWKEKNLFIKALCVLYRDDEDKMYMVQRGGVLEKLYAVMLEKPFDLTEAPVVLLLSLAQHPELPPVIMDSGGLVHVCTILRQSDVQVINDLIHVFLKTVALYDRERVDAALEEYIPVEKSHLRYLDSPEATLWGSEYGGLVQEFLQSIVRHRWDQKYLLEQFDDDEFDDLQVSPELLDAYQKSFMELDLACRGFLEIDALKVIMVLRGEMLDDDQLQDIFDEYDVEGTGRMHFRQFIDLMSGWKNRFGAGAEALAYQALNTGVIGRARRAFNKWWNAQKLAQERIDRIKARREAERLKVQQLAATFMTAENIRLKREQQMAERAARVSGGGSGGGGGGSSEATDTSGGASGSPARAPRKAGGSGTSSSSSKKQQQSPLSPGGISVGGLSPSPDRRGGLAAKGRRDS